MKKSAQNVPKEDLISRKAAIEAMTSGVILVTNDSIEAVKEVIELFTGKIKSLPPAESERKTGHWIHKGGGSFICSECGEMVGLNAYRSERAGEIFRYCPHCGADMRGDTDEVD